MIKGDGSLEKENHELRKELSIVKAELEELKRSPVLSKEDLALIDITINTYLLNDWGCQCIEIQREQEIEKQKIISLKKKLGL